jgi:hypothetical protein
VAGGVREGACPGHTFTIDPISPTSRSRRLQLCAAANDSLVCVAVFAGVLNDAVAYCRSRSGSLAIFPAIRCASSRVSSFAAARRPDSSSK